MTMTISGSTGLTFPNDTTQTTAFTNASPTFTGTVSVEALTASGNLTFSSTGQRILGDFSNATVANQVIFQTSTTNGNTTVYHIPNGTGNLTSVAATNSSDVSATSTGAVAFIQANATDGRLGVGRLSSSGSFLPLTMFVGGGERLRIDTSGNVGIGTSSPSYKLDVAGSAGVGVRYKASGSYGAFLADNTSSTGGGYFTAYQNGSQKALFGVSGAYEGTTSSDAMVAADATGGAIRFYTNGSPSEKMRLDSSGNLGIGTSSPATKLHVNSSSGNAYTKIQTADAGAEAGVQLTNTAGDTYIYKNAANNNLAIYQNNADMFRITSAGLLQFNSGYGSAQTAYGCRIWVNFNGQGTIAIRGSGGVSSLTDNGTVNYTVNFSITLPDTNYATAVTNDHDSGSGSNQQMFVLTSSNTSYANKSTTALQVRGYNTTSADFDPYGVNVMVFR